jgi:hypothetical protein
MPERRDDGPFAKHILLDDEYQHIIFEQQRRETRCDHSLEFWVAVQTEQRGVPVVIQWCMRCQASEVLTWEEYQVRKARNTEYEYDDQEDWLDILR